MRVEVQAEAQGEVLSASGSMSFDKGFAQSPAVEEHPGERPAIGRIVHLMGAQFGQIDLHRHSANATGRVALWHS